jgi:hypothetical protein
MRGIIARKGAIFSFKLDKKLPVIPLLTIILMPSLDTNMPKREFKVFGHNGIQIGQWWPRQICALRDGAHGNKGGGISRGKDSGVRSVVLNC